MKMETFENHFNELVALINMNNNATSSKSNERVKNAFDELSQALGLTRPAVALLVWALNNMDGDVVELSSVASQIDYSEDVVNSSIEELKLHRYLVEVDEDNDGLDVTAETKALIINHYCFYKILNG